MSRTSLVSRCAALAVVALLPLISMAAPAQAAACTVDAKLVNSCRPWLGAWAASYPNAGSGFTQQINAHETRIGRTVDVVHQYHLVGNNALSAEEIAFAKRPGTILYTNWKLVSTWSEGTATNATTDANVVKMATSLKSLGSKQVMLTLFHEPENDATTLPSCPAGKAIGNAGTPAQYRAMWRYVHDRFEQLGVTNVVWVMNYMGYKNWDCTVRDFWPGNDLVDWVTFGLYPTGTATWNSVVARFYNVLVQQSDASHDFVSKPWGLGEFGMRASTQQHAYEFYADMRKALTGNTLPRLKLYMPFDTAGAYDNRLGYTSKSVADPAEQTQYNLFANDPKISGSWTLAP